MSNMENIIDIIKKKRDELDIEINSKNELINHNFIMRHGTTQLFFIGKLEAYNEIIKLYNNKKEDNIIKIL